MRCNREVALPADHAHKILDIFAHFEGKPGHVLLANHFLAVGGRLHWSASELQEGIEDAYRMGWIEPAELGWRLTDGGFAEAARAHA